MLTSRAEYRLLLRDDNADLRLSKYGHDIGLLNDKQYNKYKLKLENIEKITKLLKETYITPKKEINDYLESIKTPKIKDRISLYDLEKRQEITFNKIKRFLPLAKYPKDAIDQIEIMIKYDGYIKKEEKEALKMQEYENILIPENIDYNNIKNIATEAKDKLNKIRPTSIGQAMRISGVNPADISILMIYLKRGKNGK